MPPMLSQHAPVSPLERYFDYEAFARELFMYDYSMGANNNVFRNI